MRNIIYYILIVICLFYFSPFIQNNNVKAAFIEQVVIHSKAISLGNAVTAYPPGIMAIHYNPAGLSDVREGIVISQGLSLGIIDRTDTFDPEPDFHFGQESSNFYAVNDPVAYQSNKTEDSRIYVPFYGKADFPIMFSPLPFGISSRPEHSKWTFAYAIYSPFAWGEANDEDSPIRFQNKSNYLQHLIYASPSFSYQVSDRLSLGFSIGFGQTALGMERDLRSPSEVTALLKEIDLEGGILLDYTDIIGPFDSIGNMDIKLRDDLIYPPSFNFGVLWKPIRWLSIGVVYQSPIRSDLKGDYQFTYTNGFVSSMRSINNNNIEAMKAIFLTKNKIVENGFSKTRQIYNGPIDLDNLAKNLSSLTLGYESGSAEVENFEFPERVQIGFLLRPFKKLRLMLDLHYENWSMKQYTVRFDHPIQALKLASIINPTLATNTLIYRKDSGENWHMSVGMEYQLKECLALRAGYENRKTNANEKFFDTFSLPDIHFFGTGIGLKLRDGVELDLAMAYMVNSGYIIENQQSYNLNYLLPTKQSIPGDILQTINPLLNPYTGQNVETKIEAYILSGNITIPFETMYELLDTIF